MVTLLARKMLQENPESSMPENNSSSPDGDKPAAASARGLGDGTAGQPVPMGTDDVKIADGKFPEGKQPEGSIAESNSTEAGKTQLQMLAEEKARDLVQLFKLLADETRLRILYFLMQEEELNVRTLCKLLDQSQPAVSHHLALLRVAGIIECRRDGKHNFYHLVPKRFQSYLDVMFAIDPGQTRKLRIEDSLLTYAREARTGTIT